jgi:predicted N-acetyltransferase YhbS
MRWVIDEARRLGVAGVGLSHVPENTVASFYERFGFRHTGELDGVELKMALSLRQ